MNTQPPASVAAPASASTAADRFLRIVLRVDSVFTGLNGLVYVFAAAALTTLLGASVPLLTGLGVFLVVVALAIVIVSRGRPIPPRGVGALIAVNAAWVVASLIVAGVAVWPTPFGRVWAVLQALFALAVIVCQVIGLRRAAAVSAASA